MSLSRETTLALQQPFDPQQSFGLHDLSSMALIGMTSESTAADIATHIYPSNDIDFMGGHIHLSLGPQLPVSMPMENLQDDHNSQNQVIYDQSQQWQQMGYADPYFDQNTTYSLRGYDGGNGGSAAGYTEAEVQHEFTEGGAQNVNLTSEEPLQSVEFIGQSISV